MSKQEANVYDLQTIDRVAMITLKSRGSELATHGEFWSFIEDLESIKQSLDYDGLAIINGREYDSLASINDLVNYFAGHEELNDQRGRYHGYARDLIVARMRNSIGRILRELIFFSKPTVAGFHGHQSGDYLGCTLVLDFRIATADTTFSFGNVHHGLPPAPGLTHLMPQYIGIGKSLSLLRSGQKIDAEEALSLGLISEIVDDEKDLADQCIAAIRAVPQDHPHVQLYQRQEIMPSEEVFHQKFEHWYREMARVINMLPRG